MKTLSIILALTISFFGYSQKQDSINKKIYLKGNAFFLPVGIINAGLEYQLKEKITLQADVFVSPWKSFIGNHAQVYMGALEGRYYFNKAFHHFYGGLNIGVAVFDITKWNYAGSNLFQRGFTILAGATIGYQFQLSDRWNIDLYLGGGNSQAFYHGYDESNPDNLFIYYNDSRKWNRSGEWIPYRGGVMIGYKL